MKRKILINAVHREQKRMAIVENGKLVEFNIQMATRDVTIGNIYKGTIQKVEQSLQAAFIDYGASRNGFLPLRDAASDFLKKGQNVNRLTVGEEIVIQVYREQTASKGALLTTHISLPGRYLVLLPNKNSAGISRKIENNEDRKKIASIMGQIKMQEGMGFIVRTAGINRKKHELLRDYLNTFRHYKEIERMAQCFPAPALLHHESDFGVCSLRDYLTTDVEEILIDDSETFRRVRNYCKIVSPKTAQRIKLFKEKLPILDQFNLEEQIGEIYRDRVYLKSGGYIVLNNTEAMITIDVNSGKCSSQKNVEGTAFKTNIEAAEEIARQLRLRDLGGLIAVDFIDMQDKNHIAEVEKTFLNALSLDKARIQMTKISKFGIMEISRQKKQPTIHEISYVSCPYCHGRGVRPSLEHTAVGAYHKIQSRAVKGTYSSLVITMPQEVAQYLLNNKRGEILALEKEYGLFIHIIGSNEMQWDTLKIEAVDKPLPSTVRLETATNSKEIAKNKPSNRRTNKRATAKTAAVTQAAPEQQPDNLMSIAEPHLDEGVSIAPEDVSDYEMDSILEDRDVKLIEITNIFGK